MCCCNEICLEPFIQLDVQTYNTYFLVAVQSLAIKKKMENPKFIEEYPEPNLSVGYQKLKKAATSLLPFQNDHGGQN